MMMEQLTITDIYQAAYSFYQAGLYQQAERSFRLLTCLEFDNYHHWMGLASALKMQKKYLDAVDAFGAAALFDAREINPLPHAYAAECFHVLGDQVRAKEALASAKEIAKAYEHYAPLVEQLKLFETRWFDV